MLSLGKRGCEALVTIGDCSEEYKVFFDVASHRRPLVQEIAPNTDCHVVAHQGAFIGLWIEIIEKCGPLANLFPESRTSRRVGPRGFEENSNFVTSDSSARSTVVANVPLRRQETIR